MITSSTITRLLPLSAQYGARLTAQGKALYLLSENASSEIASVLGPTLVMAQAVSKAMQTVFAWVLDDATFATFPLSLQARIAEQAATWHECRAALGTIAFVRRLPNLGVLQHNNGITLEEILVTPATAGIAFTDFWGVSLGGQASLERLVRCDLTLTHTLDFDPLTEATTILAEVSPRIPDVPSTLKALRDARTTPFSDLIVNEGLAISVQGGDTLSLLAGRHMNDPEQWQVLAELNGLRSPYLSESILDQLGAVVAQKVLQSATVVGQYVAHLTDVSGLYRDQQIRFVSGVQDQILTIESLTLATNIVHFAEAFTVAFPSASVATVYNPTYDIRGRVLKPGDLLILPGKEGVGGRSLARLRGNNDPARMYGTDLTLNQGDFTEVDGDLGLVSGVANLSQALRHRFLVERGQLSFHPLYGTGLYDYLGWKNSPFFSFLAEIEAQQTVLRDPRIAGIADFLAEVEGDTIFIEMMARTQEQEQFPVPRFTLDVRA